MILEVKYISIIRNFVKSFKWALPPCNYLPRNSWQLLIFLWVENLELENLPICCKHDVFFFSYFECTLRMKILNPGVPCVFFYIQWCSNRKLGWFADEEKGKHVIHCWHDLGFISRCGRHKENTDWLPKLISWFRHKC